MKKYLAEILVTLLSICALCAAGILFGCGSGDEINLPGNSYSYNSFIDYSFMYTDSDECPNGNFNESNMQSSRTFELNKTNYIVVYFSINNTAENTWRTGALFNVKLSVSPLSYVSAALEEASTNVFSESVNGDTQDIILTYSVPELKVKGQSKTYRIAVAFSAIRSTTVEIDLSICLEKEDLEGSPVVADCVTVGAEKYFDFSLEDEGYTVNRAGGITSTTEICYIPNFYRDKRVTAIEQDAFTGRENVQTIIIPDSVTRIGINAFSNTAFYNDRTNWENNSLYIGKHLIKVDYNLSGVYAIKEGTLTIADYALNSCLYLDSITIPDSVTNIGEMAFSGCKKISSITFPDGLKTIGDNAFYCCESLNSIIIPDSVISIGAGSFSRNLRLKSVIIGSGVVSIGEFAFSNCTNLKDVTIGKNVAFIGSYTFVDCSSLDNAVFKNLNGWRVFSSGTASKGTTILSEKLSDPETAATYLVSGYRGYSWKRS